MANTTVDGKRIAIVRPMRQATLTSPTVNTPTALSPVCQRHVTQHGHINERPTNATTQCSSPPLKKSSSATVRAARSVKSSSTLKCGHAPVDGDEYRKNCPYYFGPFTAAQASKLLGSQPPGTFLLRDSSDPRYHSALSVQTRRGPTSIRISRTCDGQVQLDCDDRQKAIMPRFDNAFELVRHYSRSVSHNECVFLEKTGRADTPIVLTRSIDSAMSRTTVSSLSSLCQRVVAAARLDGRPPSSRVCANCFVDALPGLDDKTRLTLKKYPFDV